MFELRCTVRGCLELLRLGGDGLSCPAGHHFDRAKQGYWNLLQPQDRRSRNPGDTEEAVMARHRWLSRGYGLGLIDAISPWLDSQSEPPEITIRTLDLGCGEGSFGPALFGDDADAYCGIDLSKRAIKLAARRWPAATWVLANADRTLPVADASVHRVVSLFGRRPASEITRVLAPGGLCIVAVPGEDDLLELREQVQQAGHRRRRWESAIEAIVDAGCEVADHKTWREQAMLQPEEVGGPYSFTYFAILKNPK